MVSFDIESFLKGCIEKRASDIHLKVDEYARLRISGEIYTFNVGKLSYEEMEELILKILPPSLKKYLADMEEIDFPYKIPGVARFRVNLYKQMGIYGLSFRSVPLEIKSIAELNLPRMVQQFSDFVTGLVLITGATGTGKSTTLASLIETINKTKQKHIITIEDPIEFVYTPKKSMITQRQVNLDTQSYASGIRAALRQDPDIIMVGEIRDKETLEAALSAAETGHLVFSTLHTNDAHSTINRIVNLYEPVERPNIRSQLASVLKAIASQRLINRIDIKNARIPACEILMITPTVADYMVKDNLNAIYELIKNGNKNEMISMNKSLYLLVKENIISKEAACENSNDIHELEQMLRGVYYGGEEY